MAEQISKVSVRLQWLKGKQGEEFIELIPGKPVRIGRDKSADICLDDALLSRLHCHLYATKDGYFIEDLGSRNGTYVERQRVKKAQLFPGSEVWIGNSGFKFFVASVPPPDGSLQIRKHYSSGEDALYSVVKKAEAQAKAERLGTNLATLFHVAKILSEGVSLLRISGAILDSVMESCGAERAFLLLQDDSTRTPRVVASRIKSHDASYSHTIVEEVCKTGTSILTVDALGDERFKAAHSIVTKQIRSVMCVPVRTQKNTLGALYVDSRQGKRNFTEEDLELLAAMGELAGVAVHRARLIENLQKLFLDTVRALVATIDAIDHYTEGHSQRVSTIAATICQEIPEYRDQTRTVQLAGLLHDIGKIVATAVIKKKGPLSESEMELMRRHPVDGAMILRNIRNVKEIATIVLHHHERWDGGGYPAGLVGEKIPFGSRVLMVADSYDAMTSDRPYRSALSIEQAVAELRDKAGSQFDPHIVDVFLRILSEGKLRPDAAPLSDSVADGFVLMFQ